ncbi:MAG: hypothetical protein A2504_15935 [Bdellovibrionales bacterium RIFOXYD12_FULL_39_22]|nr:MAG: hypothetical protein A2385_07845 [Bdellovibrionales bacterium RIFOXYB1_FULL_39_21]OFZ43028.1 MAG: hypothetical protein A2485_11380 [Bdellovibrionales bacterium RIFOXYC12_FULL_39_17]OFZ50886.1 MAG: hypothetical protein A2404_06760 [Bdellovibrionales bacterium RIFOXYC1_FULL_39_130]OFZ78109.1 MAG: hypothetical protein A2560_01930 [Bdellovibrionales bacterium RIFOXYD1_FULL_39_84]OFZ93977.1 MAG: hypothetical protein A2504_15935 [Bdellovibrionales bacterium RIFOXYD12_FULL_39_22]HLE10426.1 gl
MKQVKEEKKISIAFLSLNYLKGHNLAINYYVSLLLEQINHNFNLSAIKIFSHIESGRDDISYKKTMENFEINDYYNEVQFESVNCFDCGDEIFAKLKSFDLVISVSYFWGSLIKRLKATPGIRPKIIYWISSIIQHEYIINKNTKKTNFNQSVTAQKDMFDCADHLIFNSRFDQKIAELYHRNFSCPVSCIYPPSRAANNNNQKDLNGRHKTTRFGYAGRWDYRKGLQELIEAFYLYQQNYEGELFVMNNFSECRFATLAECLDRENEIRYHQLIRSKKLQLFDWQSDRKTYLQFLANCDIVIIPSLYDPFNMVAYDAITLNRPLLLSQFCGIAELIPNSGQKEALRIINPLDITGFCQAMIDVQNHINNRPLTTPYTFQLPQFDKLIQDTFEIYRQLL